MSEALTQTIVDMIQEMVDDQVTRSSRIVAGDNIEPMVDDIHLDSLDAIDLIFQIEGSLDVEIPVEKLSDILPCTVDDLVRYVQEAPKKNVVIGDQVSPGEPVGSDLQDHRSQDRQ